MRALILPVILLSLTSATTAAPPRKPVPASESYAARARRERAQVIDARKNTRASRRIRAAQAGAEITRLLEEEARARAIAAEMQRRYIRANTPETRVVTSGPAGRQLVTEIYRRD
jgi:hypothetical protein